MFQISSSYEGPEFEKFKYLKESLSERDLVDRISNSISMRSAENIDFDIEHPERDEPKVIFKGACNVSDQIKYVGKSLAIVPMAIFTPPQMSAKHQGLARINYPLHKSDTLVYQLSFIDQYLVKLPADVQIASKYGSYGHRYFMDGNRIVAERSFLMHAGNYQAEERKELYAFMEMVANAQQKSTIVFNPKQ
ncbi:MAG: hypothetical protein HC819_19750 [Cyclobacteriaceae bacterium]|nr:hypothetical protein [Cyclobacteriaceae bacterium]